MYACKTGFVLNDICLYWLKKFTWLISAKSVSDREDIQLYLVLAGYPAIFHYLVAVPGSQETTKWNQIILLYRTSQAEAGNLWLRFA